MSRTASGDEAASEGTDRLSRGRACGYKAR